MRNLETFHPKWVVSIKTIAPLMGPVSTAEEEEEPVRASKDGGQEGNKTCLIYRFSVYMNSQGLWQHAQGPQRSVLDGILELKEVDVYPQP